MVYLYLLIFLALAPVLLQVIAACRAFRLPVVVSCFICLAALIYLGSLLPGVLGQYKPIPVSLSIIALALLAAFFLGAVAKIKPASFSFSFDLADELCAGPGMWNTATAAVASLAAILLTPLFDYCCQLPSMFLSSSRHLNWDGVSYHLPALVECIQSHSLWSLEGPYQSFSQGFELYAGLSVLLFHSTSGLVAANAMCIVAFIATIIYLTNQLLLAPSDGPSLPPQLQPILVGALPINKAVTHLMAIAFWLSVCGDTLLATGKNDLFEGACLLAALAYLLDLIRQTQTPARACALRALAALSYGLAIAAKPPAFFYLPLFLFMAGITFSGSPATGKDKLWSFSARNALATIGSAVLIGGFFECRNLIVFHQLGAPDLLRETARMCLIHQWRQPELYAVMGRGSLYFASGLISIALLIWWNMKRPISSYSTPLCCLALFCLIGWGTFAFLPTSVTCSAGIVFWQDRKIMAVYVVNGIVLAIFVVAMLRRCAKVSIPPLATVIAALALLTASAWIGSSEMDKYPLGLPGYEQVKGLPETQIYRWVQARAGGERIYSAGLRPWGLYGRNLDNQLFYDLHSHILEHDGQLRLLSIMKQFHPDLILISVDPHAYTGVASKPALVHWLEKQPYFVEVYNDATVSGFKVNSGWENLLRQYTLPDEPVHMHG